MNAIGFAVGLDPPAGFRQRVNLLAPVSVARQSRNGYPQFVRHDLQHVPAVSQFAFDGAEVLLDLAPQDGFFGEQSEHMFERLPRRIEKIRIAGQGFNAFNQGPRCR